MKGFLSANGRFLPGFFLIIPLFVLIACSASRPVPDWLTASHNQLERYKLSYLSDKAKNASIQFQDAVTEIKKSGDLRLLARAYLVRMAVSTAVLEDMPQAEFLKIDAVSPDRQHGNFFAFLRGEIEKVDEDLLPERYQGIYRKMRKGVPTDYAKEIENIDDPLSRLIAVGILVRLHQENEAVMNRAIDTASGQGWKKAVLVYLERLKSYYDMHQEAQKALEIKQRIELIRDKP